MPSFAGNQQQDAHEFTRFLLERLRKEFVRGAELAAASGKPARLLPRGREHGEGSNVMVDLGIPNPLRRTRSLRGGQRNGGAWTDSGANTPDAESPGSARRGGASPAAVAAGLAAAGLRDETRDTDATMAKANGEGVGGATALAAADGEDGGGYVIVSRWGAVRHKLGCLCRPCKSRRKTDTGEGEVTPAASPAATPLAASRIKSEAAAAAGRAATGSGSGSVSVAAAAAAAGAGGGDSPKPEPARATATTGAATTTNTNSPAAASPGKRSAASDADADAAEPGSSGVDGVGACALDRSGLPSDPVWRMFGGMALSRICCSACGHASTRREPFLDISLPIPPTLPHGSPGSNAASPLTPGSREMAEPGEGPGGCVTLQQCLAAHTRNETLAGPGRYYCERCGQVGGATKQTRLQTLPPVLCLHLKRFTWRGTGARSKLNAHVDFPTTALDLAPYMETEDAADGSPGPTGKEAAETAAAAAAAAEMAAAAAEMAANGAAVANGATRTRRNSSGAKDASAAAKAAAAELAAEQAKEAAAMAMANWIDADEPSEGSARPRLYDLAAAVVHHGSGAASGHYTVYARADAAGGGAWTEFNDDKVLPATEEEVKTAGGYLFFYVRRAEEAPSEGRGEV